MFFSVIKVNKMPSVATSLNNTTAIVSLTSGGITIGGGGVLGAARALYSEDI
jgi:hypothetical protein